MPDFNPYDLPGEAPNPYSPPEAELGPEAFYLKGEQTYELFSVGAVWRMAWPMFKDVLTKSMTKL